MIVVFDKVKQVVKPNTCKIAYKIEKDYHQTMEAYKKGTCTTMCPLAEKEMRENERLLHRLEMISGTQNNKVPKADPKKIVKCFSRSAADKKMDVPHLLRPFDVLYKTVQYLLTEVVATQEVSTLSVYNFVWDRLRAVRQDMTIQSLPPHQCALLLEPMVRFHTLYGFKLCELPVDDYDPVLNKKQLLECLKNLLVCFDMIEVPDYNTISVGCLEKLFNDQLELNDISKGLTCDRKLMESLYIVSNIDDNHSSLRYLQLPKKYRCECVKLSYEVAAAHSRGNYVRACRLASQLPPLALCLFSLQLPYIQRRALLVMSHAYHSKQLTFPSGMLARFLMFNSEQEARGTCAHYGLTLCRGDVLFNKTSFKVDTRVLEPKKMLSMKHITNPFTRNSDAT